MVTGDAPLTALHVANNSCLRDGLVSWPRDVGPSLSRMVQWSRRRSSSGLLSCLFSRSTGYLFGSLFHLPSSTCDCDGGSDLMLQQEMTSPLQLLQVVEIATCLLVFSLKCGANGKVVAARSLPMCSPKVSLLLSVRSVGLQGSSARGLRRPALRLAELAHVQSLSQCVLHAVTALHPA